MLAPFALSTIHSRTCARCRKKNRHSRRKKRRRRNGEKMRKKHHRHRQPQCRNPAYRPPRPRRTRTYGRPVPPVHGYGLHTAQRGSRFHPGTHSTTRRYAPRPYRIFHMPRMRHMKRMSRTHRMKQACQAKRILSPNRPGRTETHHVRICPQRQALRRKQRKRPHPAV